MCPSIKAAFTSDEAVAIATEEQQIRRPRDQQQSRKNLVGFVRQVDLVVLQLYRCRCCCDSIVYALRFACM